MLQQRSRKRAKHYCDARGCGQWFWTPGGLSRHFSDTHETPRASQFPQLGGGPPNTTSAGATAGASVAGGQHASQASASAVPAARPTFTGPLDSDTVIAGLTAEHERLKGLPAPVMRPAQNPLGDLRSQPPTILKSWDNMFRDPPGGPVLHPRFPGPAGPLPAPEPDGSVVAAHPTLGRYLRNSLMAHSTLVGIQHATKELKLDFDASNAERQVVTAAEQECSARHRAALNRYHLANAELSEALLELVGSVRTADTLMKKKNQVQLAAIDAMAAGASKKELRSRLPGTVRRNNRDKVNLDKVEPGGPRRPEDRLALEQPTAFTFTPRPGDGTASLGACAGWDLRSAISSVLLNPDIQLVLEVSSCRIGTERAITTFATSKAFARAVASSEGDVQPVVVLINVDGVELHGHRGSARAVYAQVCNAVDRTRPHVKAPQTGVVFLGTVPYKTEVSTGGQGKEEKKACADALVECFKVLFDDAFSDNSLFSLHIPTGNKNEYTLHSFRISLGAVVCDFSDLRALAAAADSNPCPMCAVKKEEMTLEGALSLFDEGRPDDAFHIITCEPRDFKRINLVIRRLWALEDKLSPQGAEELERELREASPTDGASSRPFQPSLRPTARAVLTRSHPVRYDGRPLDSPGSWRPGDG